MQAALDLGTNSFHLVVARFDDAGRFQVVAREKETVRLGSGGGDMKELSTEAMDRGVASLDRMRQIAESHDAPLTAVATSAVREASNSAEFLARCREEAGASPSVIHGSEEARLIHLGALAAVPMADKRHLVIDIGGGSTEFIIGEGQQALLLRSLKLGAIRLTDRFFVDGAGTEAVNRCRTHVRAMIAQVAQDVDRLGFDIAVGCSGTIETVIAVALGLKGLERPDQLANTAVSASDIRHATEAIVAASTDHKVALGVDPKRADLITAGAVLLNEIVARLGVDELTFSDYALREGLLCDFQRTPGVELDHLSDLRRSSVLGMAARYEEDLSHAQRITAMALELYDETTHLHGRRNNARGLLEAASLLHNVGLFVSHSSHHKHSYYLIRHSEALAGFRMDEIELIAQVARYHRKSAPKDKHPEFVALSDTEQQLVRVLAGILRIAIALDRTRSGSVLAVRTESPSPDKLIIWVHTSPNTDLSLELYTARLRSRLLGKALGVDVRVDQHIVDAPAATKS